MTANVERERFQSGTDKYVGYLETPEGRLRLDLAFANLQDFLPQSKPSLYALDVGGGTGAMAVRLGSLGVNVALVDSSTEMLNHAKRAAQEAGVLENVELKQGDAAQLENLFRPNSFDVIVCHNLLEYLEDPVSVLRGTAALLRDSSAMLSVLVRNRAGEVLKAAIKSGDLDAAAHQTTAQWGYESLYGGRVRLFTPDELLSMSKQAGLAIVAMRGVRVVADYLPPQISREGDYQRILELESELGRRPEFAAVARYTQYFAHRTGPVMEEGA